MAPRAPSESAEEVVTAAPEQTPERGNQRLQSRVDSLVPHAPASAAPVQQNQNQTALAGVEPGALIGGKYRLLREIGSGGMGSVWAATHESLRSQCAVKFLRPLGIADGRSAERFLAEARIAAVIKHRFVVDVFDMGTTESGAPFMVLELLEGQALSARMQDGPRLSVKEAVRFIAQCLSGLDAVHRAGVVHRDLKPENIFIISDNDGVFPKLLDFGVALMNAVCQVEPGATAPRRLTQDGTTVGTPIYMAPEQLRGRRELDARADLYSMSVILFELLTGRLPYPDDNVGDLMVRIVTQGPPRLADLRPELGSALSDALLRGMASDREQRFASAAEMRAALNELIPALPDADTMPQATPGVGYGKHTEILLQSAPVPFADSAAKPRFTHLWTWAAAAALGLAVVAAAAFWPRAAKETTPAAPPSARIEARQLAPIVAPAAQRAPAAVSPESSPALPPAQTLQVEPRTAAGPTPAPHTAARPTPAPHTAARPTPTLRTAARPTPAPRTEELPAPQAPSGAARAHRAGAHHREAPARATTQPSAPQKKTLFRNLDF